uniref:Bm10954, isoform d n=1 Tax=Brugia malayi TaxID=6279 RepID=A0A1I9G4U5_BRUMA|nr:Bm10954, isoform d [Brugia malayi]
MTGAFTIYETTGCARIDARYVNYTMVICGANWRYPCEWRLWHADRHRYFSAEKGRKSAECDMAYMCVLSAGLLLPTTRKTHRGGAILSAEKRNARNLAEGSTGKEKGTFGVACIEERTGVNSVKNSIHEVGRVLMVWRGREAVGAGRTTKWALLSTFHPFSSLPTSSSLPAALPPLLLLSPLSQLSLLFSFQTYNSIITDSYVPVECTIIRVEDNEFTNRRPTYYCIILMILP